MAGLAVMLHAAAPGPCSRPNWVVPHGGVWLKMQPSSPSLVDSQQWPWGVLPFWKDVLEVLWSLYALDRRREVPGSVGAGTVKGRVRADVAGGGDTMLLTVQGAPCARPNRARRA